MIPAESPNAIAKNLLLKDLVKRAMPLPIPVLNPANVAKANPRYILFNSIILLMFNIAKILISALIIFIASEIGKRDSFLGAIIVSLPMISLITISWIYFETKDIDKIIAFSHSVFAMIMPSLSFFITLPYFLKKINFIPSMFLSISIMIVLYFALSMLYKKIGVDI
tara:strand:+ start:933 stop:1433 length:501 start_codon:yes stop_codon:yes gene_type:complete